VLHYLLMSSLFAVAGVILWWIHRHVVDQALVSRQDTAEWRRALLAGAWIMIGILTLNAQGYVKMNQIAWEISGPTPGRGMDLLISHLGVLGGTASLMWLVALALKEPAVLEEPAPQLATYRVMVVVAEKLLPRFWWAALGFGIVFGYTAGPGPIMFLAAELTLFWLMGRISLFLQRRQLQSNDVAQAPDSDDSV
jgi:hypothetical protein